MMELILIEVYPLLEFRRGCLVEIGDITKPHKLVTSKDSLEMGIKDQVFQVMDGVNHIGNMINLQLNWGTKNVALSGEMIYKKKDQSDWLDNFKVELKLSCLAGIKHKQRMLFSGNWIRYTQYDIDYISVDKF